MKKVREVMLVDFVYDNKEEREDHVKWMESNGWESSGQVRQSESVYSDEFVWIGKFSKRLV